MALGAMLMASLLAGCAKEIPKCSDEDTFGLIRNIMTEQFFKEFMNADAKHTSDEVTRAIRCEFPRADSFDEAVKRYKCDAKMLIGDTTIPITYESQLDDSGNHLVSVGAFTGADRLALAMALEAAITSERAKNGTVAKAAAPVAAAEPSPATEEPVAAPQSAEIDAPGSPDTEGAALSVSFDCAKAGNFAEKAVCSDDTLKQLDGALAANYTNMLAADMPGTALDELRKEQSQWLAVRNQCADHQCVLTQYRSRIEAVCDTPVMSGKPVCLRTGDLP